MKNQPTASTMVPVGRRQRLVTPTILVASFILAIASLPTVSSFAAWLKCYVDLDETEVIMNNPVLLAAEAPYKVHVEVRLANDVTSAGEWTTEGLTYPAGTETVVQARLRVPDELVGHNVQYVMETSKGATFVPATTCKGERAHARSYHDIVELTVTDAEESVELVAGWASGHAAVSLTLKTVLQRDDSELEL